MTLFQPFRNTRSTWAALAASAALMLGIGAAEAIPIRPAVVGGQPAEITQAPWQALMVIGGAEICGASYLSPTWLLTAAHCVDEGVSPGAVQVFTGISRLDQRSSDSSVPVAQISVHPGWNPGTNESDLALIRLARPVSASSTIQPIVLPTEQNPNAWPAAGTPAQLYGWGAQAEGGRASDVLRRGDMTILTAPGAVNCGSYGSSFRPNAMICAGGPGSSIDACQGDSGGGLVVNVNGVPMLAGVTSTGNGCAVPDFPGIYARVTSFLPWITGTVGALGMPPAAPGGVKAAALGKGKVRVNWTPPTVDGNSAVTGFTATAAPGGKRCTAAAGATTCTISGLRKGARVTVTVSASNALGQGAPGKAAVRVR